MKGIAKLFRYLGGLKAHRPYIKKGREALLNKTLHNIWVRSTHMKGYCEAVSVTKVQGPLAPWTGVIDTYFLGRCSAPKPQEYLTI